MNQLKYERPILIKNPVGLMQKAGARPSSATQAIDGVSVDELRRTFGSPLFVFSERRLRAKVRAAKAALLANYAEATLCWSYKTNYLNAICAVFHQEGSLAEVVSGMEYEKARRLGVPGERIVFNGPAKTHDELVRAISEGALLHADHHEELALIERISRETQLRPRVGLRVSLDAGVYPRWDRFGFSLESGAALEAAKRISEAKTLQFGGLHCHIGTFILDPSAYGRAARKLYDFATELRAAKGIHVSHLDLGGGFASNNSLAGQYHGSELTPSVDEYISEIGAALTGLSGPRFPLLLETGRALVDDAGTLISSVISSKKLPGGRPALVIDAGVNLLFTSWWYKLGLTPSRLVDEPAEDTIVYGPLCMNIDCVRESVQLPALKAGDALCIHPVGAYAFTQSMQFIHLRPACVMIDTDGTPQLIRRAEILDDLMGPEILPARYQVTPSTFRGSSDEVLQR